MVIIPVRYALGDTDAHDVFSTNDQHLLLYLPDFISGALEAWIFAQRASANLEPHVDSTLEQHRRFVES